MNSFCAEDTGQEIKHMRIYAQILRVPFELSAKFHIYEKLSEISEPECGAQT